MLKVGGVPMVEMSKKLRELRVEMELTQGQVAKRIGITSSVISAYENGIRQPSFDSLIKLAYLYGVSSDYLLGISDRKAVEPRNLVSLEGLSPSKISIVKQLISELRD